MIHICLQWREFFRFIPVLFSAFIDLLLMKTEIILCACLCMLTLKIFSFNAQNVLETFVRWFCLLFQESNTDHGSATSTTLSNWFHFHWSLTNSSHTVGNSTINFFNLIIFSTCIYSSQVILYCSYLGGNGTC